MSSKIYTKDDLTWGFELELSNVPKSFPIPAHLGKWEYCEADIINTKGEFANVCADPLGINPPVGGEINTVPSLTREGQVNRIMEIINLFKDSGNDPDVGFTSHSHIHVHIKGLEEDVLALKRVVSRVCLDQDDIFTNVYQYDENMIPKTGFNKARTYLKNDGARKMPEWMAINIIEKAKDYEDVITMFKRGIDGETKIRPIRYGINLYSLKNCRTIEFRCFRGTLDKHQLDDCFEFIEEFILSALNRTGESAGDILNKKNWDFPKMQFDKDQATGWENTKHHVELINGKNRKFWEAN